MSIFSVALAITWSCLEAPSVANIGGVILNPFQEALTSADLHYRRSNLINTEALNPRVSQYDETHLGSATLYAQMQHLHKPIKTPHPLSMSEPIYVAEASVNTPNPQPNINKSSPYKPVLFAQELGGIPVSPVLEPHDDPIGDYLEQKSDKKSQKNMLPSFEIGLPTLMDGRYLGDVNVRVRGDEISIQGSSFISLLKPDLTFDALIAIEQAIKNDWLTIGTFLVEGVNIKYDSALQQIEVSTPIGMREQRVLRLGAQRREQDVILAEPGKFSFFLTPTISSLYNWNEISGEDKGFQPLRGSVNVGGRLFGEKGIGFLSRQSFTTASDSNFRRDETTAYYDIAPRLMRVSGGDLRPRGLSFQSTPRIAGLSIERFFDLEPNRLFRPVAQSSFELERPSTVEIRLNGATRREITLQPGRYNIEDLPLTQGSNLVDLVIRDDLGRERIISDQSFFDFGLLEPGFMDFSLAAGVKTGSSNTGVSYSDELAMTGFIRRGISNSLTMGADIQGDQSGANGGITALYASPIGVFTIEGSASDYKDNGNGYAGLLGYRYIGDSFNNWNWSFNANGRYFSENFSTLDGLNLSSNQSIDFGEGIIFDSTLANLSERPFSLLLNAGGRIRKGKWALSSSGSHSIGRGLTEDRTSIVGGITYQLSTRMNFGVFGNHSIIGDEKESSALIQLNYRLGRGRDVRSSYDTETKELDVRYTKTDSIGVGALSYSVGTRNNFESDRNGINANAFYTGNRFEASLDHSIVNQGGVTDNNFDQVSRASLATSLVFVDGAFGVGRPVQSTFSILEPHKSLKGKRVLINPTERGYSNSSDFLGAAVATEGQAFSRRSVYYDVEDLPIGYDLGEGQYSTRAPIFAGYKIPIGSGSSFTIVGNLKDADTGEALQFIGGRLESLDNPDTPSVAAFTNRNGRLAATGLKSGRYTLIVFTDPEFRKDITIPEGGDALINIGDLEVNLK